MQRLIERKDAMKAVEAAVLKFGEPLEDDDYYDGWRDACYYIRALLGQAQVFEAETAYAARLIPFENIRVIGPQNMENFREYIVEELSRMIVKNVIHTGKARIVEHDDEETNRRKYTVSLQIVRPLEMIAWPKVKKTEENGSPRACEPRNGGEGSAIEDADERGSSLREEGDGEYAE